MSMEKRAKTGKLYSASIKDIDLNNGSYNEAHHLLELKEVPASLTQLRTLFQQPENADIVAYAQQGGSFQECIARTATFLNIALDGLYEVGPLCEVLCNAILSRDSIGQIAPHKADGRLVEAEIVETDGEITLQRVAEATEEVTQPKLITEIN